MHSVAANRLFRPNSVPAGREIRGRFESGHALSLIVFHDVRKKKSAAAFRGSLVRRRLNAQSGATKGRYRVQGRLLWLLAMEDVHAPVRAVSKTQTEFDIKHIPRATISRKPDLVNCIQTAPSRLRNCSPSKLEAGSNPYPGAETPESTNTVQVNVRVALVKLEDFPAQFWLHIIKISLPIRVAIPQQRIQLGVRTN